MKTEVFTLVRNSLFHLNFIYKLQTKALILWYTHVGYRHHSNLQTTANFLIFSKPI